jgi:hypothetical protein
MRYIQLTRGKFAQVDDDDFECLNQFTWQADAKPQGGYDAVCTYYVKDANGKPKRVSARMHHLVMTCPPGKQIDHRDRNALNNQSSNLRVATRNQNCQNRMRPNKTGYKGVGRQASGGFTARLSLPDGERVCLGTFPTVEKAALAYNEAATRHFGEFAAVNNVKG